MIGILFLVSILFMSGAEAQNIVAPLDIPLSLSGNFGELRSNHFHSGIDFKTRGITGLPVKAVKDGYISRISINPNGYGKAVYIAHPDGTTSVYGHLEGFTPKIEATVRDSQYRYESFAADLQFHAGQFALKQGEIFALSGNTGSSGGPHLHFELRDTKSERPFDPLPFFRDKIRDNIPPEVLKIILLPQVGKGAADSDTTAWGEIGIAVKAFDRMNGTSNIYGVKEIILKLNGNEIFHSLINDFSFEDTRYLNSFIDYGRWTETREFYMKSFIEHCNRFDAYLSDGKGTIIIDREQEYRFEYILKDAFGNTSVKRFTIKGKKQEIPSNPPNCTVFHCRQDNYFNANGLELSLPEGSLYSDIYFNLSKRNGQLPFAPVYSFGIKAPLHNVCPLSLEIPNDVSTDKTRYGIVAVNKKNMTWLGGKYANGRITAEISELGDFTVAIDTVPPTIKCVRQKKAVINKITFRITDNLSGIDSYRATVNQQFVLLEYDPKTGYISGIIEPERIRGNINTIEIKVTDRAGNIKVHSEPFSATPQPSAPRRQ
jgi:hypothetical protein